MAITRTGVVISTNTTFGDSDDSDFYINGGQLGINQVPVSGLTPDTVYYAKGYVQQDGTTITDPSYTAFRTLGVPVEYLKITNTSSSTNTVNFSTHSGSGLTPVVLEYTVDNGTTWNSITIGPNSASANIPANGEMMLKGSNATLNGHYSYFCIVVSNANISGDINTLLNEVGGDIVLPTYAFHNLFSGNANTLTFNGLKLPSTSVSEGAYSLMFQQCGGLTAQPTMPSAIKLTGRDACSSMFQGTGLQSFSTKITVTSINGCLGMFNGCSRLTTVPSDMLQDNDLTGKNSCYFWMFKDCVSLSTLPNLPATSLSETCYFGMFYGCTGIISAQSVLPAKTVYKGSYNQMFYGCTALVNPPALPADKLAISCYNQMFYGCTSLQASPTLNASMLYPYSFKEMFYNCRSLKEVHIYLGDVSATDCLNNWLYGVAASGIFYWDSTGSNPLNTIPLNSASGCPSGWSRTSY